MSEKSSKVDAGIAHRLYVTFDEGGNIKRILAKDPRRPAYKDITDDLARYLAWLKSGGVG